MGRIKAPHSVTRRVARSVRRLVAGCAAGCGVGNQAVLTADLNAHPLCTHLKSHARSGNAPVSETRSDRSARALRLPLIMTPKSPYTLED